MANLNLDITLLSAGYVLMFAYAMFMLSQFNFVEQGRYLADLFILLTFMIIKIFLSL